MLLASNYGNTFSIAIEVTSSPLVDQELWEEFKEAMAANWGNYSDKVSLIIIIHSILIQMSAVIKANVIISSFNKNIIVIILILIIIIILICCGLCRHSSCSYHPDDQDGQQLLVRPHWAKELPRTAAGLGINDYMRKVSYSIHMGRFCMTIKWPNPGLFTSDFGRSL